MVEMIYVRLTADILVTNPEVGHGSMLLNHVKAVSPRLWCFCHPISWNIQDLDSGLGSLGDVDTSMSESRMPPGVCDHPPYMCWVGQS